MDSAAVTSQAGCAWCRPEQSEPLWHGQTEKSDFQTWRGWGVLKGRPLCQRCWQDFLTFWNPPTTGAAAGEPGLPPCCRDPDLGVQVWNPLMERQGGALSSRDADPSVYKVHRHSRPPAGGTLLVGNCCASLSPLLCLGGLALKCAQQAALVQISANPSSALLVHYCL